MMFCRMMGVVDHKTPVAPTQAMRFTDTPSSKSASGSTELCKTLERRSTPRHTFLWRFQGRRRPRIDADSATKTTRRSSRRLRESLTCQRRVYGSMRRGKKAGLRLRHATATQSAKGRFLSRRLYSGVQGSCGNPSNTLGLSAHQLNVYSSCGLLVGCEEDHQNKVQGREATKSMRYDLTTKSLKRLMARLRRLTAKNLVESPTLSKTSFSIIKFQQVQDDNLHRVVKRLIEIAVASWRVLLQSTFPVAAAWATPLNVCDGE